jgi:outer membrane protein OmpA-like peptidoglycan-associated protein
MKTFFKTVTFFMVLFAFTATVNSQNDSIKHHYFQISPRVGYDIVPMYKNNTPYIDYKGGLEFGISLDYYWRKFGVGIDYDNITNNPKSTYPTDKLNDPGFTPLTRFALSEKTIKRSFIGIGPDYQYQSPNNRFTAELNTRVGISSIKGGRVLLIETTNPLLLNFHAGYDQKSVLSFKTQLRFNYFFIQSKNFGAHFGVYYLKHMKVLEESESGISAGYWPFAAGSGGNVLSMSGPKVRSEPCKCDISSIGIFAGITYRILPKSNVCPVCGTNHTPHCCNSCGCGVTVTAKDKYTGELLPDTDVVLVDTDGNITNTGKTNNYGVVVFQNVNPNDYTVKGKLFDVNLQENLIARAEFKDCLKNNKNIQKEILYNDTNFILKGKAVACNTDTPIEGVSVVLKNLTQAEQKNTMTDKNGVYIFHLKQKADYSIYGKKSNYMSQVVQISTKEYDRNTTLFVKLEICLTYVDCNVAIPLKNIHFDLDKDFVREDAKLEFNKLVAFMRDNPSVIVELSSHTDSQGSDAYNIDLSQRRATNSKAYIVSQGIDPKRLIAKGYGETRLLNRCKNDVPCTDKEHEVNRRTEFKVLCPE